MPDSFERVQLDEPPSICNVDEPTTEQEEATEGDEHPLRSRSPDEGSDNSAGVGDHRDSSSEDEDSSTSSSSEVLTDSDNRQGARIMGVPSPAPGTQFIVHKKSRMLRMLPDGNKKVLLCGGLMQESYELASNVRFDSSVCAFCRRHVQS